MRPLHRLLAALTLVGCGDAAGVGAAGLSGGAAGVGGVGADGAGATGDGIGGSAGSAPLPVTFEVAGVVVDETGRPLAGALVLQGGTEPALVSAEDGSFLLPMTTTVPGVPTAVAAQIGYRSAGVELFEVPSEPLVLTLVSVSAPDNASTYTFFPPGDGHGGSTNECGHCHATFAEQFQRSRHAYATKNPKVQHLYAGVRDDLDADACEASGGALRAGAVPGAPGDSALRCYVGDGVLPDLNDCGPAHACDDPSVPPAQAPTRFGACADCHSIGMDGPAGGRDLLEAEGIAYEDGNHCDACHHVRDVVLDAPPGVGGRLVMQRPREKLSDQPGSPIMQAMFGPLPDVPNPFMGGSFQPKFKTAEFCAGCHEQRQAALVPGQSLAARFADGLPTHSTFSEWSQGPAAPDTPCQDCHMPPVEALFNTMDVADESNASITFGFGRPSSQIRAHTFRGPLDSEPAVAPLIESAAALVIEGFDAGGELVVDVTALNVGAGHAIPTGEPMRAMFVLVEAEGCAKRFRAVSGATVPALGGTSRVGVVGVDLTAAGPTLDWPALAGAAPGVVLRAVRPTGTYWDYDGVGLFAGATLSPMEKGYEVLSPLGESDVVSVNGTALTLFRDLDLLPGDVVYVVDPPEPDPDPTGEGGGPPDREHHGVDLSWSTPSDALAGVPGIMVSRVLTDADGRPGVPHHRATDILFDTRIRPQEGLTSTHGFATPSFCFEATVRARLVYRPHPWALARERGWFGRDYVIAEAEATFPLQ